MFPFFDISIPFLSKDDTSIYGNSHSTDLKINYSEHFISRTFSTPKIIEVDMFDSSALKNVTPEKKRKVFFETKASIYKGTEYKVIADFIVKLTPKTTEFFVHKTPFSTPFILDLSYFKKSYSHNDSVLNNLELYKKQYISICKQFNIVITDSGFNEFIQKQVGGN